MFVSVSSAYVEAVEQFAVEWNQDLQALNLPGENLVLHPLASIDNRQIDR